MGRRDKTVQIHETEEIFDSVERAAKELGYNSSCLGRHISGKEHIKGLEHLHIFIVSDSPKYCLHCGVLITDDNVAVKGKYKRLCYGCYSKQRKIEERRKKNKFANSHYSHGLTKTLWENQKGKCVICSRELNITLAHIDHIVPSSKGGKTEIDNLQFLCEMCNRGKFTWSTEEYIAHCKNVAEKHNVYYCNKGKYLS